MFLVYRFRIKQYVKNIKRKLAQLVPKTMKDLLTNPCMSKKRGNFSRICIWSSFRRSSNVFLCRSRISGKSVLTSAVESHTTSSSHPDESSSGRTTAILLLASTSWRFRFFSSAFRNTVFNRFPRKPAFVFVLYTAD